MISATDLKNGKTFEVDGKAYKVVKYTHSKIGRGGANVKVKVRNLQSGKLEDKTFNSTRKIAEINTHKKPLQYLYIDGDNAVFMDPKTFEQTEMKVKSIDTEIRFINEGDSINVLMADDVALSIEISPKVVLKVTKTDPGVKGDTASNVYKPAILENGLAIKVPLFIKENDKVKVDTRTGEYVERVK